jgi:nicotinate-nucleotide adenylyltransferase
MSSLRIALYGGTFDPVHHGHLILARDAIEQLSLDRVIFIPAAISPHKPGTTPAPARARWEMLQAAIAGDPRFALDGCELERPGPSFAIDTVEIIRQQFAAAALFYLIGEDNVAKLDTWQRIDDLRNLVTFVVFDRGQARVPHEMPKLSRRLDISATEIRRRVGQSLPIDYFVPPAIATLIAQHHLYKEPAH